LVAKQLQIKVISIELTATPQGIENDSLLCCNKLQITLILQAACIDVKISGLMLLVETKYWSVVGVKARNCFW